ncbi:MAG: delta 1-pyrroline-5-carboxylate synthetase [Methanobacteriaceae archaeon]|nr:delta 1-pyrroline-5-carboxylate synthetase [Methanobacteriaceae archaeon]
MGGSLFPKYAIELAKSLEGQNCLIVVGGGEFANLVRKYDSEIGFSNDITHEVAINSMDILAKLIYDKLTFGELCCSLERAQNIANSGKIPIMLCSKLILEEESLKHSWEITSDSIAAFIANELDAKLLIATNVDGIYDKDPSQADAKFINEIDVKKLLSFDESSIDLMLPVLLNEYGFDCYVVNGKIPQRVLSIINEEDCDFPYTFIHK